MRTLLFVAGHRHPFLANYKVAYSSTGLVVAADLHLYCNAGNSWDLSHSIMDRLVFCLDQMCGMLVWNECMGCGQQAHLVAMPV